MRQKQRQRHETNYCGAGDMGGDQAGYIGRIPVRNLWLLMLYASELFRAQPKRPIAPETNPDDLPDLVAELLAHAVELRLRRNLSLGYQAQRETLNRVRGRVEILPTERRQWLARGRVVCRFEDLTLDTPRNRYVRAALQAIAKLVRRDGLAHRCRKLANNLQALGVSGAVPSRAEISSESFGRHDAADREMVAAAKLAFDLALPTEETGTHLLSQPEREAVWVRRLFEKAMAGFYRVSLGQDWRVQPGKWLDWQIDPGGKTPGIDAILPKMQTDIMLDHLRSGRRIVIDTKFNAILTGGRFREESLRSGYLYQMYTYLHSQTGLGEWAETASGLLLHPCVDGMVDEAVVIQGHCIRFATVDLAASAVEIREQLMRLCELEFQQNSLPQ